MYLRKVKWYRPLIVTELSHPPIYKLKLIENTVKN